MKHFDLRDTIIPFSLLQAANHFSKMAPGEFMEVIFNDPSPAEDLQSILPAGRFEAKAVGRENQEGAGYRIVIRKI